MLSPIDPENSTGSCGTTAIRSRNDRSPYFVTSTPSISTRPDVGSKKRGIRLAIVVLPAPVRPTSATSSPGPGLEADAVEDLAAGVVSEAHVLEDHVSGDAGRVDGSLGIQHLGCEREHLAHAARAHPCLLQRPGRVGDRRQRPIHRREVGHDHEQAAQRERPVQHVQAADDQHQRGAGQRDRGHPDREQRFLPRQPQPRRHRLLADLAEAIQLVALAREALDRRDRREDLERAARAAPTPAAFTVSARSVMVFE